MNRKKAFTLVEILVAMIISMVVIVAVLVTMRQSLNIYDIAEAAGVAINDARYTSDAFYRRCASDINNVPLQYHDSSRMDTIKILGAVPPTAAQNEHYIFLSNGVVTERNKDGDLPFEGSEHIKELSFSMPQSDAASDDKNYILKTSFTSEYKNKEHKVEIELGLFNAPGKQGNISGDLYAGPVLFYITQGTDYTVTDIKIFNGATDVSNKKDVLKTEVKELTAKYTLQADDASNLTDESLVEWYISGGTEASADISTEPPNSSIIGRKYWKLTDAAGDPLLGQTIAVSGDFYISTASGKIKWDGGGYGVIKCRVIPKAAGFPEKEPVWGPFVELTAENNQSPFWRDWIKFLETGENTDDIYSTPDSSVKLEISTDGEKVVRINPNGGNNAPALVATVALKYIAEARRNSLENDNPGGKKKTSFSSISNYSIIVEAENVDVAGYGLLLNGRDNKNKAATPSELLYGYVLQYDNARKSFPIRLFIRNVQTYNAGSGSWPTTDDKTSVTTLTSQEIPYGGAKWYSSYGVMPAGNNLEYSPRYMQNKLFYGGNDFMSDIFTQRTRVMYTILEYYMDGKKEEPHYIVRMKYLKPKKEVIDKLSDKDRTALEARDPFYIGPDFYYSEPVWYGRFVSEIPQSPEPEETPNEKKTYQFTVCNFSDFNNQLINIAKHILDWGGGNATPWYPMKLHYVGGYNDQTKKDVTVIARGMEMNVREQMGNTKWGTEDKNIIKTLYSMPMDDFPLNRPKTGIRLWGGNENSVGVKVYNIDLVPGFSKKELQAIMPAGASVYTMKDLTTPAEQKLIWYNPLEYGFENSTDFLLTDENVLLFRWISSNGNGNYSGIKNGIMGIQYTKDA
ncbi:MAG: prepilin-type N-terminal cleavage/methylation domain-containing protein, partial [Cloacibacillus sp.]